MTQRALMLCFLCIVIMGCGAEEEAPKAYKPLQPLIYTELPNLTPEAAEIRERRLIRELVDGQVLQEQKVQSPQRTFPVARDANTLGKIIFDALIQHDESIWDYAFVSPKSYARIVHVKQKHARKVIDELMGRSQKTWDLFTIRHISEAPEGGLASVYEFAGLELGTPRVASGRRAKKHEHPDQYWGNRLKLKLKGADVVFTLSIPKILNVVDRQKNPSGQPVLCIASPVKADRALNVFVAAGLHLKPELLRTQEYPYPLAVGNFWRYRRFIKGQQTVNNNPMDAAINAPIATDGSSTDTVFDATESLLEVISVERYRGMRLVKLRKSYNDQSLTSREFYWLMTPRQLFSCGKRCVRKIQNVSWLLAYMQRNDPLFEFPLVLGRKWGKGMKTFAVDEMSRTIKTPAGIFISSYIIKGQRGQPDPMMLLLKQTQALAPGRGVVRLTRKGKTPTGKLVEVIEELVELRVMP